MDKHGGSFHRFFYDFRCLPRLEIPFLCSAAQPHPWASQAAAAAAREVAAVADPAAAGEPGGTLGTDRI